MCFTGYRYSSQQKVNWCGPGAGPGKRYRLLRRAGREHGVKGERARQVGGEHTHANESTVVCIARWSYTKDGMENALHTRIYVYAPRPADGPGALHSHTTLG
ncbi:hypothetical protein VPNG_07260 [Cytospora leucostoma]|uniref:Uncharacterized protein n=1 Tax=Cytospora leucostoma TaxID=1230097 RepID=A0A423WKU8_9PEZI|nr:hypothetical protein VPNG_07260 [Cytospora leucostoma]